MPPNQLRYAAPTGTVLIRWEGARRPIVWTVLPPDVDPHDARVELARRYLHIFGPTTPEAFAEWVGIGVGSGVAAFKGLTRSLTAVRTQTGEAWILTRDEATFRTKSKLQPAVRLHPSGDTYFLLQGSDRELLVPKTDRRSALWTPRVWPGAVIMGGGRRSERGDARVRK